MKSILTVVLIILLIGCGHRYNSNRYCSYNKINRPSSLTFDFNNVISNSLLASIQKNTKSSELTQIIYKSRDMSLDTVYWLTVIILIDSQNCYLSYNRNDGKDGTMLKINKENRFYGKLKKSIDSLPSEFLDRNCLVADGTESIFVMKKGDEIFNFFNSSGHDCWIADSTGIPMRYLKIFELVDKLLHFSKFK